MANNWQKFGDPYYVPEGAIIGGTSDGYNHYVGRAPWKGQVLPAKVVPKLGKAYISFGGEEVALNEFEFLIGGSYKWQSASNGKVPAAAVMCGMDPWVAEPLYIGRAAYGNTITLGRVLPVNGCIYIPYYGGEIVLSEYEVLVHDVQWVSATPRELPEGAVLGGYDTNGDEIYVGRVNWYSDVMPAKVIPKKQAAYFSYSGLESRVEEYEVLVGTGFEWKPSTNGKVPAGAFSTGVTSSGDALYVGRANYNGSLSVGKVHPAQGCIFVPYGGQEIKLEQYEVLVHK